MTQNQISYWSLQETKRANQAREAETHRSNRANEYWEGFAQQEKKRSNQANEKEKERSNKANEAETHRANVEKEKETARNHLAQELEAQRHNLQGEDQAKQELALKQAIQKYTEERNAKLDAAQIDKLVAEARKIYLQGDMAEMDRNYRVLSNIADVVDAIIPG